MTVYLLEALNDHESSDLCGVYSQRRFAEVRQHVYELERKAYLTWLNSNPRDSSKMPTRRFPYSCGFDIKDVEVDTDIPEK